MSCFMNKKRNTNTLFSKKQKKQLFLAFFWLRIVYISKYFGIFDKFSYFY